MIAVSFLPAATQMIYDMGLQDLLHGVTFECPAPALAQHPKVVRCVLEGHDYSSQEIDRIFSASKAQGKSLYYVDEPLLAQLAPDVIFTQDVCEVCQIDTACTQQAVHNLAKQPLLVALTPNNLEDVFQCAITIATALAREEAAYRYLAGLTRRTDIILDTLRTHRAPLKRVMLLEWMAPIYNCGHWIPFQVAQAGGVDMLSNPAGDAIVTPWEKIVRYDPEVLVIAPCGFTVKRSREELHLLRNREGWQQLQAVKNKAVFLADYDLFTQPSASTLVEGITLLAALFHPTLFQLPAQLQAKCQALDETLVAS
ncbi:iron complex transport system substrate-binding protein [Chitinophaga costaii]|uniref:Iron complex transport system substrate-binding protein n=1 Tax=Chitinophaga costaii TaxID=1335309 RepID=A0A1C4F7C4_9BACT|nr:ABC transporter substrate-binding protein [Chitinophaga costaii]SCC51830.1 iron complex transport system substrate-binding protein [Chitinophaga costaii]